MIFKQIISKENLLNAIKIGFDNDIDLLSKYHYLDNECHIKCVTDTHKKIIDFTESYAAEWFELIVDNRVIGFTVISQAYNILYSFAINIEYRNVDNLTTWFEAVSFMLDENFTCLLYAKNERAIDFLVKNGMLIFDKFDDIVTLNYN
jgi:hypothetical protein